MARRIDANGATDRRGHSHSSTQPLSAELKNLFEFSAYFTQTFACRASLARMRVQSYSEGHLINRKAASRRPFTFLERVWITRLPAPSASCASRADQLRRWRWRTAAGFHSSKSSALSGVVSNGVSSSASDGVSSRATSGIAKAGVAAIVAKSADSNMASSMSHPFSMAAR